MIRSNTTLPKFVKNFSIYYDIQRSGRKDRRLDSMKENAEVTKNERWYLNMTDGKPGIYCYGGDTKSHSSILVIAAGLSKNNLEPINIIVVYREPRVPEKDRHFYCFKDEICLECSNSYPIPSEIHPNQLRSAIKDLSNRLHDFYGNFHPTLMKYYGKWMSSI